MCLVQTPYHVADVLSTGQRTAPHGARISILDQVVFWCIVAKKVVMATIVSNAVLADHAAQLKLQACYTYAIRVGLGCLASVLGVVCNSNVSNTNTVDINSNLLCARFLQHPTRCLSTAVTYARMASVLSTPSSVPTPASSRRVWTTDTWIVERVV